MENLELWNLVFRTDPAQTKDFNRPGGFKGTSIRAHWIIKRATEVFGLPGVGWGWEILEDKIESGAWFSRVKLWYKYGKAQGSVTQWGGTRIMLDKDKGVDDECAKKSVTDAITKCLSYLGFGGDVHMNEFDGSKYIAPQEEAQKAVTPARAELVKLGDSLIRKIEAALTLDVLKETWGVHAKDDIAYLKAYAPDLFPTVEQAKDEKKAQLSGAATVKSGVEKLREEAMQSMGIHAPVLLDDEIPY